MAEIPFRLDRAPIIEALLDIECDLPIEWNLREAEEAISAAYQGQFPKKSYQWVDEWKFEQGPEGASQQQRRRLDGFRFHREDDTEVVQVRARGFSFNRLQPYETLDTYLTSIAEAWSAYCHLAGPLQVLSVGLRYINRIQIPEGRFELTDYFKIGTTFPCAEELVLFKILAQHVARQESTGHLVQVTLNDDGTGTSTFILDIQVSADDPLAPDDWSAIETKIQQLRKLKNDVFKGALTDKCLELFKYQ
jgi:uncharacterized protein (TIGR04255 family)